MVLDELREGSDGPAASVPPGIAGKQHGGAFFSNQKTLEVISDSDVRHPKDR
jgi:hypothetical protein